MRSFKERSQAARPVDLDPEKPLTPAKVLFRLAELEEYATQFYAAICKTTHSKWICEAARVIAQAEQQHKKSFLQYAAEAELDEIVKRGEYQPLPANILQLLYAPVFASKEAAEHMALELSEEEFLLTAIQIEKDVVMLLTELQQYVPEVYRNHMVRVIEEEKDHQKTLEGHYAKNFCQVVPNEEQPA